MSADGLSAVQRAALGYPRVHLRRTDSTNDRARALAIAGAPHGTLVTASAQTAGRGRQGRRWSAPANSSVLMSLLLRASPTGRTGEAAFGGDGVYSALSLLPLVAAVAVCDVAGARAQIKWPNDIVVPGPHGLAKLAGILAEGRPADGWAVLGVGLNVAVRLEDLPAELEGKAATLGGSSADVEPTLMRLLAALQQRLTDPLRATLDAWRARDALCGRPVTWASSARAVGSGRAEGIDGVGRLVVALPDGGRATLTAGEVHLGDAGNSAA